MKQWMVVFVGACLLVGTAAMAAGEQGKDLYQKKMCAACHGAGKKGGDLKDSKMDKATLTKFMKDPKAVKPTAAMPAFKGTDAELAALVDYAISLRK